MRGTVHGGPRIDRAPPLQQHFRGGDGPAAVAALEGTTMHLPVLPMERSA